MPISFRVDPHRRLIRTTDVGAITLPELMTYVGQLVEQGLFSHAQLIDGRAATLQLTAEETREFAAQIASLRAVYGQAPVAFVAGNAASYHVAVDYADVGVGSKPFQVVADVAAAEVWIELSGGEASRGRKRANRRPTG
jgi:hypothetical protein